MILDDIVASKRQEIEQAKQRLPEADLQRRLAGRQIERPFAQALRESETHPALIAELKRKSPSRGMLRERFDPPRLVQEFQGAGASALSILTDEPFFGGSLDILREAQAFSEVPILRKDFILEPYQVYEAVMAGADTILLIARLLPQPQLAALLALARTFGMEPLVEVHSEEELGRALEAQAGIIGINHRDLGDFSMHADLSARLVPRIPRSCVIVAESGIQSSDDVMRLRDLGVQALLIGESLMTAPDPVAKVRELFGTVW